MIEDAEAQLRQHGLQVTAQRLAVLRALATRPHATADELAEAVRGRIGSVSRQAVYNALSTLVDKGVVRRIQPAGSAARYEDRVGDNHHHLICRGCGRMLDVDLALDRLDDSLGGPDHAGATHRRIPQCPRGSRLG